MDILIFRGLTEKTSLKDPWWHTNSNSAFPNPVLDVGGIQHTEELTIGRQDGKATDSISFARSTPVCATRSSDALAPEQILADLNDNFTCIQRRPQIQKVARLDACLFSQRRNGRQDTKIRNELRWAICTGVSS